MKFNRLTNFAIFVLVIAAVFQTGKLWLGNTDSHNFFYSLHSSSTTRVSETNGSYDIIEPENTVVGYGNKKFNMLYSDRGSDSVTKLCENVIGDVFRNGVFDSVSQTDWSSYIDGKAVILEYPFYVSAREYILGYGISNSAFSDNVNSINYIVVAPGSGSSDTTYCYFIDGNTSETYKFTLTDAESSSVLYNAIQNMQYSSGAYIDYISTVQSGMNIFDSIYVPQWVDGEYSYSPVSVEDTFSDSEGIVDTTALGDCVNNFFSNYVSGEDASVVNGVYTFSDGNIVVKYYENGVMEYYNYDIGASGSEQTLSSAYTICRSFINKDTFINNPIYLSGVETRNEGLVFYYDYAVNNIPVNISAESNENTGMNHAIEVVVSNGSVKRYKRYAVTLAADSEKSAVINVDMISAWDDAITNYTGTEEITSISNMAIGYYLNGDSKIYIKWFTSINGSTVVGESYK